VNPGDPATAGCCSNRSRPRSAATSSIPAGRQFASKDDPNWKILADWVNGQKL
jgi:hypothetical protein